MRLSRSTRCRLHRSSRRLSNPSRSLSPVFTGLNERLGFDSRRELLCNRHLVERDRRMVFGREHIRGPMLDTQPLRPALRPALGKTGEHQAYPRPWTFRIRILRDRLDGRRCLDGIGVNSQEITKNLLGIEAYFLRVGPHVGAAEQSTWPARDVVTLEPLEEGGVDFRFFGNRHQRDTLTFTLRAKPGSEGLFHRKSRERWRDLCC